LKVDFTYHERIKIEFNSRVTSVDKEAVRKSMSGADSVIHMPPRCHLYTPEDIYNTDVVGTRRSAGAGQSVRVKRLNPYFCRLAVYGVHTISRCTKRPVQVW
jgi:hypothetical protein